MIKISRYGLATSPTVSMVRIGMWLCILLMLACLTACKYLINNHIFISSLFGALAFFCGVAAGIFHWVTN